MLAHKAMREGKVAAEVRGPAVGVRCRAVPAVVYTDPQVAWCGLTEEAAGQVGRWGRAIPVGSVRSGHHVGCARKD